MAIHPILIDGTWRASAQSGVFHAENPATGVALPDEYPVSTWTDVDAALTAASEAAVHLRVVPPERIARFLVSYAERLEAAATEIVDIAHLETALPVSPRLSEVELPRTTGQLRQAAAAALEGSWSLPTIDTKLNIRSVYAALGPVAVFGPNNFPFAFNGVSGGDFAAAIAAGNPVIAKAHPSHPGTSRRLAEAALAALQDAGLPLSTVQLIYRISGDDGCRLVSDTRIGATGFTGSRTAGLKLKAAADAAGKPIYLELSSVNPVVILPGALAERGPAIVQEFAASSLMAAGQMCTNPGLLILLAGEPAEQFISATKEKYEAAASAPQLSSAVTHHLGDSVQILQDAGARVVTGGQPQGKCRFANTLLRVDAAQFLEQPARLQTEAFGNASLVVVARDAAEALAVIERLDGNLTGSLYADTRGSDDALMEALQAALRWRVGRLLHDKMPTGVAVSPAMNHGGPYPATGHPGFTAVGIPAALRRFAMLQCYDNVRQASLPVVLRDEQAGQAWRSIDGRWTQESV